MRSRTYRRDPIRYRLADHRRRLRQMGKPRRIVRVGERYGAVHVYLGQASQHRSTAARRWRMLIRLKVRMHPIRME